MIYELETKKSEKRNSIKLKDYKLLTGVKDIKFIYIDSINWNYWNAVGFIQKHIV
jgi:hypothetical protein